MKRIIFLLIIITIFSCSPFKKNKDYANDFLSLNKMEYTKKYMSLYNIKTEENTEIRLNEAYVKYCNNGAYQIVVFCNDNYVYTTVLLTNVSVFTDKIPTQRLFRNAYYKIEKNILKLEMQNVNINSVIEEGIIKKDTIQMNKTYLSKRPNKITSCKTKYEYIPRIKVYKFDDDHFMVESK